MSDPKELREKIAQEIETATFAINYKIIPEDLKPEAQAVWEAARLYFSSIARGK